MTGATPILFLPGWATDTRLFTLYGAPRAFAPFSPASPDFAKTLADALRREGVPRATIAGWSLGAAAAVGFARAYPEFVERLILFGLRPRYPHAALDAARQGIVGNRRTFLAGFYRECFLPGQTADYRVFKEHLLETYLEEMDEHGLLAGLDYLASVDISAADLQICPTTIVHGACDIVAPIDEVTMLAHDAAIPVTVLPGAAHAAFATAAGRIYWER